MPEVPTQNIAPVDTTAHHDSVHVEAPFVPAYVNGFPDSTSVGLQQSRFDTLQVMTIPQDTKPVPYENTPIHDATIMSLVFLAFFYIALTYRKGHKYISDLGHHMFSVRKRQNMFDDHTVSETQIMTALIANTCLLEAIALYLGIRHIFPGLCLSKSLTVIILSLTGVTALFYFAQFIIFHILGFVFANKVDTKIWMDGFKATQSIFGLVLLPITFIMLLYPTTVSAMLIGVAILYFLTRLVFIIKGFRIFFNNYSSTIYFILYLCTLEIVPVVVLFAVAVSLCKILG